MTIPLDKLLRICLNCGEQGPHFVPPSMGDPGMFICEANPERVEEALAVARRSAAEEPGLSSWEASNAGH